MWCVLSVGHVYVLYKEKSGNTCTAIFFLSQMKRIKAKTACQPLDASYFVTEFTSNLAQSRGKVDAQPFSANQTPTGRGVKRLDEGTPMLFLFSGNDAVLSGVPGCFWSKTGERGCWPIRNGQQHSLSLLFSGTPVFGQKSTGSIRFWPLPFPRIGHVLIGRT